MPAPRRRHVPGSRLRPDAAPAEPDPAPAPAPAQRRLRRLPARRRPVRHRRASRRRQGSRLRAHDRRAPGPRGGARHVGPRHHRPRVRHPCDRGQDGRDALPGRLRFRRAQLFEADRREPRAGLPEAAARRHGRGPRLHARDRVAGLAADGRRADVRGPAARGRGHPQAVPARPLPRAGDHDGHGSPLLSEGGTAARREWKPGSTSENPRIPGQGNLPQVRDADAARHTGVHRRRGRRRGRLARRRRVGRQGADPRRRPRQGRRRQGGAIAGRGARSRRQDSRHAARHAPDGSGGAEGPPAADRGRRRHPAGALRRDGGRPRVAARVPDGELRRRHGYRGGRREDAGEDTHACSSIRSRVSPTPMPTTSRAGSASPRAASRRAARCCRASTARSTRPTRRSPRSTRWSSPATAA